MSGLAGRTQSSDVFTVVRVVVALTLLLQFAISARLWLDHPVFGVVPTWGEFSIAPPPFDRVWLGVLGVGLIGVAWSPRWTPWWLILLAIRVVPDRITWQPWLVQEALLLAVAAWGARRGERALPWLRVTAASVYVWSGFAKLHYGFLVDGASLVETAFGFEGASTSRIVVSTLVAVGESALGVAYLVPRTRRLAASGLIVMHAGILLLLGPLGTSHNAVVWPWNVALPIVLLAGVDVRRPAPALHAASRVLADVLVPSLVTLLMVIGPALGTLGLWDPYLSFRLYALRYPQALVLLLEEARDDVPALWADAVVWDPELLRPARGVDGALYVNAWSEQQLGAFAPASRAVHEHVARRLLGGVVDASAMRMELRPAPPWNGHAEPEIVALENL